MRKLGIEPKKQTLVAWQLTTTISLINKKSKITRYKILILNGTNYRENVETRIEPTRRLQHHVSLPLRWNEFVINPLKKERNNNYIFSPFQACSFLNVFICLNACTNTNITFYYYSLMLSLSYAMPLNSMAPQLYASYQKGGMTTLKSQEHHLIPLTFPNCRVIGQKTCY